MKESIVIVTIYSYETVIAGTVKLGASRLILLKDSHPPEEQNKAVENVIESIGKYAEIETITTSVYDICQVAFDVVELIDSFGSDAKIYLNVSADRKTKSLGLMFAGYSIYQEIITLPNMPFELNEKQRKVLSQFIKSQKGSKMCTNQ